MGRVKVAQSMADASAAVKERPLPATLYSIAEGASMPIGARGRHMGLDVGDRRIGVALSDETATLASALTTLTRTGGRKDAAVVADLARAPRSGRGRGGPAPQHGRHGAGRKRRRCSASWRACGGGSAPVPVVTRDERLTTVEAEERLREAGMGWKERKHLVDQVAAVVILQEYLDDRAAARRRGSRPEPSPALRKLILAPPPDRAGLRRVVPRDAVARARGAAILPSRWSSPRARACSTSAASSIGSGLVRHPEVFRVYVLSRGETGRLRAGEYALEGPMSLEQIVDKLVRGDVVRHVVTFPEGMNLEDMARLAAVKGIPVEAFLAAARNPELIRDLDPEAKDLEGYLFPDTYDIPRGPDAAAQLVARMVRRFRTVMGPELTQSAQRPNAAPGRDPGLDRGDGDGASGGEAARGRGVPEPAQEADADADGPDRHLRAAQGGDLGRQHPQGRPRRGLAVQHLPLPRAAAGPDRLARAARRCRRRCIPRRAATCTS